jgi:hypothetical protein
LGVFLVSITSSFGTVTTAPVGYVTETIKPAGFNLVASNLSGSVVASGAFGTADATTATDVDASFTASLSGSSDYVLTLTSGANVGVNTGVTASSATVLATDDDLSSLVSDGDTYEIRNVLTIADLFGADNSAELEGATAGNTSNADIVWVQTATGYTKVYYNAVARPFPPLSVGWKGTTTGGADASTTPVYFTDAIWVQVQRSAFSADEEGVDPSDLTSKDIVLTGSVVTHSSEVAAESGFNYMNRIFPGDMSLAESGLENDIAHATAGNTTDADLVWVPDGSGGYNKYYYNGVARPFPPLGVGWKGTTTGNSDASSANLSSAFILERKGSGAMVTVPLPAGVNL